MLSETSAVATAGLPMRSTGTSPASADSVRVSICSADVARRGPRARAVDRRIVLGRCGRCRRIALPTGRSRRAVWLTRRCCNRPGSQPRPCTGRCGLKVRGDAGAIACSGRWRPGACRLGMGMTGPGHWITSAARPRACPDGQSEQKLGSSWSALRTSARPTSSSLPGRGVVHYRGVLAPAEGLRGRRFPKSKNTSSRRQSRDGGRRFFGRIRGARLDFLEGR